MSASGLLNADIAVCEVKVKDLFPPCKTAPLSVEECNQLFGNATALKLFNCNALLCHKSVSLVHIEKSEVELADVMELCGDALVDF